MARVFIIILCVVILLVLLLYNIFMSFKKDDEVLYIIQKQNKQLLREDKNEIKQIEKYENN